MIWTAAPAAGRYCGSCGLFVRAGAALALLTTKQLPRCPTCAGAPINEAEVDLERYRIEREALAASDRPTAPSTPIYRHAPQRQPTRLSDIAGSLFDVKARQAGDVT